MSLTSSAYGPDISGDEPLRFTVMFAAKVRNRNEGLLEVERMLGRTVLIGAETERVASRFRDDLQDFFVAIQIFSIITPRYDGSAYHWFDVIGRSERLSYP